VIETIDRKHKNETKTKKVVVGMLVNISGYFFVE